MFPRIMNYRRNIHTKITAFIYIMCTNIGINRRVIIFLLLYHSTHTYTLLSYLIHGFSINHNSIRMMRYAKGKLFGPIQMYIMLHNFLIHCFTINKPIITQFIRTVPCNGKQMATYSRI